MAKKGRNPAAEPTVATAVPSRDSLQRLSFLYQASSALDQASRQQQPTKRSRPATESPFAQSPSLSRSPPTTAPPRSRQPLTLRPPRPIAAPRTTVPQVETVTIPSTSRTRHSPRANSLERLARHLARQMSEVAKKATVRMDPGVKRTVCQRCGTVLVPGVSASVRIKPSRPHAHLVSHRCLSCRSERRLPAPPHSADPSRPEPDNPFAPSVARDPAAGRMTKRERREARQARVPVFFERKGHVVVRGSEVVARDALQ